MEMSGRQLGPKEIAVRDIDLAVFNLQTAFNFTSWVEKRSSRRRMWEGKRRGPSTMPWELQRTELQGRDHRQWDKRSRRRGHSQPAEGTDVSSRMDSV